MIPLDAIASLALLVLLAWIIYRPWQDVCTDFARQSLFEARDKIFDLAHEGKLDFASAEYRVIRTSLEKSIRFAHGVNWPRFIIFMVAMQRTGQLSKRSDLRSAIDGISDEETRQQVRSLVNEAHEKLVVWMALKSPLLICICLVVALLVGIRSFRSRRDQRLVSGIGEVLQREAEASGGAALQAA